MVKFKIGDRVMLRPDHRPTRLRERDIYKVVQVIGGNVRVKGVTTDQFHDSRSGWGTSAYNLQHAYTCKECRYDCKSAQACSLFEGEE